MNKYLNTNIVKKITNFYKTTLPSDIIFIKADASTSYGQVEKLTRGFNIHYRACIGSLSYLLSTRVDLSFALHKLSKFSSNPGKVNFEVLVHLFRYIRDNKNLGLKYYAYMKDAPLSDLLIKYSINTENQSMYLYDSSWGYFTDTDIITGEYNIFYQGGPIGHSTHVPGKFDQSSAESYYN